MTVVYDNAATAVKGGGIAETTTVSEWKRKMYEGFALRAGAHGWLRSAASRVDLLEAFDELWFVTSFEVVDSGRISGRAQRICGRQLGQRSG
jgi:hypothetical protein